MAKGRRVIQTQKSVVGILWITSEVVGAVEADMPKDVAAIALRLPKTVFGITIVLMSL